MVAFAVERGWSRARCEGEFQHFVSYHLAEGTEAAEWNAKWQSWVFHGLHHDDKDRKNARHRQGAAAFAWGSGTDE